MAYDAVGSVHSSFSAFDTKSSSLCALSFKNDIHPVFSSTKKSALNNSTMTTCAEPTTSDYSMNALSPQLTVFTDFLTPNTVNTSESFGQQPSREFLHYKQLYKNAIGALKLITSVMKQVFFLACPKNDPAESYMDCLRKTKGIDVKRLQNDYDVSIAGIGKLEKNNDASEFDVSLLYGLIRALWENEADSDTTKAVKRYDSNTDGENNAQEMIYLSKARELRNKFCHGDKLVVSSLEWFEEMKDTLQKLIYFCGKRYSLDVVHINEQKSELRCAINNLDNREHEIKQNFCQLARSEAKSLWEEMRPMIGAGFDPLDPSYWHDRTNSIYVPLTVIAKYCYLAKSNQKCSCMTVLDTFLNTPQNLFAILSGEAGSGKTNVLKTIAFHFFGIVNQEEVRSLDEFDLLHYLECRTNKAENIKDFVKENFPTAYRDSDVEDEFDCFRYFRNLILIDGYDQCNEFSLNLVNEIIRETRSIPKCKIMLTSRFNKSHDLENLLNNANIAYCHYELIEILSEEEKFNFLKAYWRAAAPVQSFDSVSNALDKDGPAVPRSSPETIYTGGLRTNAQRVLNSAASVPSKIVGLGFSAETVPGRSTIVSDNLELPIDITNHLKIRSPVIISVGSVDHSRTNAPLQNFPSNYVPENLSNNASVSSTLTDSLSVLRYKRSDTSQTKSSQYAASQALLATGRNLPSVTLKNSAFSVNKFKQEQLKDGPVPSLDEFIEKFDYLAKEVKDFLIVLSI